MSRRTRIRLTDECRCAAFGGLPFGTCLRHVGTRITLCVIRAAYREAKPDCNCGEDMGWNLFRKPKVIDDAVFGLISFVEKAEFWEGLFTMVTSDEPIDMMIRADASGPREEHRRVAREFAADYDRIWSAVNEVIGDNDGWKLVGFDLQNVNDLLLELTVENQDLDVISVAIEGSLSNPKISIV